MINKKDKRLYDYTKAFASGITTADVASLDFLRNLYLETRDSAEVPPLVFNGDYPARLSQAYDDYLDLIGRGFGIFRGINETDEAFRQKIKLRIIQNHTVEGLTASIKTVFSGLGFNVNVTVLPAVYNFFDGISSTLTSTPIRGRTGSRLYRVDVEIVSSKKIEYPNFVYKLNANTDFIVGNPGVYSLYLNPFGAPQNFVDFVEVSIINEQFPNRSARVAYSSNFPEINTKIELGFLSSFNTIMFVVKNALGNPIHSAQEYLSYLTFNNSSFDFYRKPEYNTLLENFAVSFLRDIFQEITAFGIRIERIAVKTKGIGD